jgi:hypothetical protein
VDYLWAIEYYKIAILINKMIQVHFPALIQLNNRQMINHKRLPKPPIIQQLKIKTLPLKIKTLIKSSLPPRITQLITQVLKMIIQRIQLRNLLSPINHNRIRAAMLTRHTISHKLLPLQQAIRLTYL